MKKILTLTIICLMTSLFMNGQYAASNFTLLGHINPETGFNTGGDKYSGCWGWYQANKNKEYAIACAQAGTYWVDVTNPLTPTVSAYKAGVHTACTWREAKTYLNFCYVVSDDNGNNSLQIFDMKYLPDSVYKVYDSKNLFMRGHALWIDGNKMYVSSVTYSNNTYRSLNVYSLANPVGPVLLRSLSQDYNFINGVHDVFARNDTVYASCQYQGLYVFKLTPPTYSFTQIGSLTTYTGSGYNHSSALTPDGKTLVMMDEVPSALPIKIVDVTNLSNMQVVATINQFPQTTPHNPFIVDNQYCFASSYEDGLQLFDISTPTAPALAGYFDTYPQSGGNTNTWTNNYQGQWGAYPFFPSRNIFALDQMNGIFMLKTSLYKLPDNPTNITESPAGNFKMSIFPNPAQHSLSFNIPANENFVDLEVRINDIQGRTIVKRHQNEITNRGSVYRHIELPELSNGIYLMQVYSGNKIISSEKLVISN